MLEEKCPKCGSELENPVEYCPNCNFTTKNTISMILYVAGWLIIIVGIIGSWSIAEADPILKTTGTYFETTEETFNYALFLAYSFVSAISGLLFFGIAEIIKLNQMIFNLMKK